MALFPRLRGKVKEAVQILVSPFADHKFKHWPASELDPESLKSLKESIASGRLDRQEQLFMAMLEKWPRLRKNLGEIANAVARMEWTVMPWTEKDSNRPRKRRKWRSLSNPPSGGQNRNRTR